MTGVFQDFRLALRQSRKSPGFICFATLILALGIGASLAIFSFVDAALIKPLPYPNPARLVAVYESSAMMPRGMVSYPDYLDYRRVDTVFSSLGLWAPWGYTLSTSSGTVQMPGARVTDNFFRTLGINPMLGRDFYAGEDSASARPAVMLGYQAWQKWLGGRRDVVGQPITLTGVSYTVIGVLPQNFYFSPRGLAQFWTTLQVSSANDRRRNFRNFFGVARLKDTVSIQTASSDMRAIAAQLERQYPDDNQGVGSILVGLPEVVLGDIRPILLALLGGAGLLLLIACVNVVSLLLTRCEHRRREIAVRAAFGASRMRLFRQFVAEGFLLISGSCALGLMLAHVFTQGLMRLVSEDMMFRMPFLWEASLNLHVLLCASFLSSLMLMLFSILPPCTSRPRRCGTL